MPEGVQGRTVAAYDLLVSFVLCPAAALLPKPRVNLTRFHGVFSPNCKDRVRVTLAERDKGKKVKAADETQYQAPARVPGIDNRGLKVN